MECVLICQSLSVRINHSDELSIQRIKRSWLYMHQIPNWLQLIRTQLYILALIFKGKTYSFTAF